MANLKNSLATILGCLFIWLALPWFPSKWKPAKMAQMDKGWHPQNYQQQLERVLEPNNEKRQEQQQQQQQQQPPPPRNNHFTDDIARDDTCREYLMQFLNGTTDAKDECQGMYNAFTAANCQESSAINYNNNYNNYLLWTPNSTSETGLIDDIFEAWECCEHISTYYTKHCEEETLDAARLFGIVAILIACWMAKSLVKVNGWHWIIPDAGACILVGAVVGLILRLAYSDDVVNNRMIFNNNLFLQILLPPIIFEAAISIDKRAFRRDLFPILTFAILGTAFSALAIGYITYFASTLPLLESLVFGALISSIDPVATLSILSSVGVARGDTLYTLVFGESLLNDGVAIVLFQSLARHIGDTDVVRQAAVSEVLCHFFLVTFGSIAIGLFCAALCTFYFWAMKGQNTAVAEGALVFTWALIPYYVADALELSGIISIMVMGFMLDYYVIGGSQDDRAQSNMLSRIDSVDTNPFNPPETLSEKLAKWTRLAFSGNGHMQQHSKNVGYVAEVISSIVETAIFAYLGLFLFNDKNGNFLLTAAGIFACVSSRAVMVLVLCALINICVLIDLETKLTNLWRLLRGRDDVVDARQAYETADHNRFLGARTQFILFTAGIRGAVSYALVQMIPVYDSVSRHGSLYKGELRAMTSATIVGVLFVFGALTYMGLDKTKGTRILSPMDNDPTLSQLLLMDETSSNHPGLHMSTPHHEQQHHSTDVPLPQRLA